MERSELNSVEEWVEGIAGITKPAMIIFCDGSREEYEQIISEMLMDDGLVSLNQKKYPGCYLYRSDPRDVARTERSTFICADEPSQVGPLNNFMSMEKAGKITDDILRDSMKGKIMYVVPYIMGPENSEYSEAGVEVTDNPYVVANMHIMTRMGQMAMKRIGTGRDYIRSIHVTGNLDPDKRYILHFPWKRLDVDSHIISVNSAYGGNALLSKKCHALRIASVRARENGWLAEHMLIMEIERPDRKKYYFAAAFPSASGKTNLAMLKPPEEYAKNGWKARLIGDDIAWIHIGHDGRLYALNPENGFFGVVPGTSFSTNPNAMKAISRNTIFTNVALTENNEPWWEGLPRLNGILKDWTGKPHETLNERAAHPNSRFTTPLRQYPSLSEEVENPEGVPLTAIIFGGRRGDTIPLVFESFDWDHGVYLGATMGVEQTAAAEGKVGEVRRDPMAMRPFCGYNISEYFEYWLSMKTRARNLPGIYYVNWFRRDKNGNYIWPGFGENIRVLEWIIRRSEGRSAGMETPIGIVPSPDSINLASLGFDDARINDLFQVDRMEWKEEVSRIGAFLNTLGPEAPREIINQFNELRKRFAF